MDKHNSYMEDFINNFDVAVIPEELYKIISENKIEFYNRSYKGNNVCKAAEISIITNDMRRRIFILYDYGFCMKFEEISIHEFSTRQGRDAEIIRLYMLMYGKEASNRKQEIDRQHYTIPNQRPKDKHCGKI